MGSVAFRVCSPPGAALTAVRDFGEGRADRVEAVSGGDEVQELSAAFAAMAARLGEREAERLRLEREVLETTERERQCIGQDCTTASDSSLPPHH